MPKFLETKERQTYKKQLAELQQQINPKPSEAEREQLRKEYLEKRNKN